MKVSPISWQNHSTCPRLDMSGLAWKFNNFSLRLFVKMQNIKSLRFLPVLPIAAVEAWQNQLGIRPFLFRINLQFFQLFMVIFVEENPSHLKVQTKMGNFPFLSREGMERWRRHEYKVSIFIKSSLQRIQIRSKTISSLSLELGPPSSDSQQDCWSCSDVRSLRSHRCQRESQRWTNQLLRFKI